MNPLRSEFTLNKYLDYRNRWIFYFARLQGQTSELIIVYRTTEKEPKNNTSTDDWTSESGTG
jgi:hypothetical protein